MLGHLGFEDRGFKAWSIQGSGIVGSRFGLSTVKAILGRKIALVRSATCCATGAYGDFMGAGSP